MSKARKRALLGTVCRQAITLSNTRLAASEMKPVVELPGIKVTSVLTSCSGKVWVRDFHLGRGGEDRKARYWAHIGSLLSLHAQLPS